MKTYFPLTIVLGEALLLCGQGVAAHQSKDRINRSARPNILFCIADDASFHHFGAAGCSWVKTPVFDMVAKSGLFFEKCYTPNAKSAPSRAVLLTGRYSWQLGEAGNHICNFPTDTPVFTEELTSNGYAVAFTGKGWAPGDPGQIDGIERKLTGKPYQKRRTTPPTTGIGKCDYSENFKDFLTETPTDKPWFFWFGSTEPHRVYEYGTGVRLGGKRIDSIDHVPAYWPDNEVVRNDMADYAFEIEYFDRQIGKMIEELKRRGELDNTLIIITSDNGMPFPRVKGNNYEYSHHMPMAMMWPQGIEDAGRRVSEYVSFIDFAPTMLQLAEVAPQTMKPMSGQSLAPIIKNKLSDKERSQREVLLLGRERDDYGRPNNQGYPIRAIMQDNMLYIINLKPQLWPAGDPETGYLDCDGSPTKTDILVRKRSGENSRYWQLCMGLRPQQELYNTAVDPDCMINLAEQKQYSNVVAQLKKMLINSLTKQGDPRMGDNSDVFDSYPYSQQKANWNFYERVTSGKLAQPWNQTNWVTPTDYTSHPDNSK